MRLDAHQHFWRYNPAQYPWIDPAWPIRRDFLPADLAPLLQKEGLSHSIAVQARQTEAESDWLLGLADAEPLIAGVVGWVDLRSKRANDALARLSKHPKFVGVRHVVQDEPDDQFLLRPDFVEGLKHLRQFDLTYDLLVFPKQMQAALEIVQRLPDQRFVLDHIAKPPIREAALDPWRGCLQEIAQAPNLYCKVSGLVTEAHWKEWRPEHFRPYLDIVFEAFGPDRIMFGSDWPVCLLAGSYERVADLFGQYARQFTPSEQAKLWGANALAFYGIPKSTGQRE